MSTVEQPGSRARAPKGTQSGLKLKKAKKAAPKKGKKGKKKEPVVVTPELLAGVAPFDALDHGLLERLAPRVEHVELARHEVLHQGPPVDDDDSFVFVVIFGDVSIRRLDEGAYQPEIINFLKPGELYIQKLVVTDTTRQITLTAMCPVKVLKLRYKDVNYLLRKMPDFRETVSETIRQVSERQISRFDDDFQRDISQFFVEERLTFSGRVKIKRMDICIECDGCYEACKERHGTDRLGPSEVKYGLTEIPQNCHNCEVPECIDKCKFGHISIHPHTQEIVIDDNCVGCTQCARGCSYGAIRMHALEDLDVERYFPDRAPDAKGKNIAQKCDNCTSYPDKACITACPTGALFQVDGVDLFNNWQQFTVHEDPGFNAVESPEGVPRLWRAFWLWFTILNTLALSWECFGRLNWPQLTFTTWLFEAGVLENGIDPLTPFRPGDFFSHALGYIGGGLCVATQLYRVGKWMAPRMGSVPTWMEAHIFTGILGGVYGFFHTAFYFHGFVSIAAFVTMVVAILTGVVGRYILFLVPRSRAGHQLALDELDSMIKTLDHEIEGLLERHFESKATTHTMMVRMDDLLRKDQTGLGADEAKELFAGIKQMASEDKVQQSKVAQLADEMAELGLGGSMLHEIVVLLTEKARVERSVARHTLMGHVLKRYRVVHVVSSNVMFAALALHIVLSLVYRVGN